MNQFSDHNNNQNNQNHTSDPFGQQPQFSNQQQFQPYPYPPKTNGKAIAGLVLGICSLVIPYIGFLPGIVGFILSILSLKEIKKSNEQGRGLAIAGLVTSIIGSLLWIVIVVIFVIIVIFAATVDSPSYY
ncbi:DUF4190 domain-containing protein [Paenibacillus sp. L3-i20]|uniref:DUF4190 domain-containing protein n=1 Tax=Paenibacillus sp. L3-i20 TaxID=2905833 RepID=UPI001EDD54E4|nr:DUF4190 domain-containing protein [Paenibacillus sp. L3-i20]GKU78166.1 hypothetical protein L3i20_v225630 [Paenibacillus sp. L3-i20]